MTENGRVLALSISEELCMISPLQCSGQSTAASTPAPEAPTEREAMN